MYWQKHIGRIVVFGVFAVGLFLIDFNLLSVEPAAATKKALDHIMANELCPVYMDRTSNELAKIYAYYHYDVCQMQTYQMHTFQTQDTHLLDFAELEGYAILNRGFMDYSWNRYRVDKISFDEFSESYDVIKIIDNPMNALAYQQTLLLMNVAAMLPSDFLRQKVSTTAQALLQKRDAIVVKLD